MDEEFQFQTPPPLLLAGGEASSAIDEAYINGVCAGLTFHSLLTYGSFYPPAETQNPLKMPKIEPVFTLNDGASIEAPPYKFFSEATSSSIHHQLPNLVSLELPQNTAAVGVGVESQMLSPRHETASYGKQQRKRQRQRLSDKTQCLQKLLPWDEKMDMGTVLEEAHKYIRFLQAQVSVLQSMPYDSGAASVTGTTTNIIGGDLGRLNRQQLLQVVLNSPVAQTQLYSKGCCIYSVEQLVLLKKKALHHQLLDSSTPKSFHF